MSIKISSLLKKSTTAIFISILLGFLVGGIILALSGFNPIQSYGELFKGVFSKPRYIVQTIIIATPVILTGISVAFAFKTGLFNIGAEGQFMMGAIAASFIGYKIDLPPIIHPIACLLGAMIFAGLYAVFVGWLKAKFGIHEVITSIMLNWIALYFNNYYVTLPSLKKPNSEGVYEVLDSARINILYNVKANQENILAFRDKIAELKGNVPIVNGVEKPTLFMKLLDTVQDIVFRTDINYGIFIAVAVAIIVGFILNKTTLGYSLKGVGINKYAAEAAGINVKKQIIMSMLISGAIAGLAGGIYITGMSPNRIITLSLHENYGFNGLSVALIANNNPIACIFSGLLFGALKYGGNAMQSQLGVPTEIINIVIGTIIFFIGMRLIFTIIADKLEKGENSNE